MSRVLASDRAGWNERYIDHNATTSSWRRIDGVEVMIQQWRTTRRNMIYALVEATGAVLS